MSTLARFSRDETGATATEYALIALFISTAIIVAATALGTELGITYESFSGKIPAV